MSFMYSIMFLGDVNGTKIFIVSMHHRKMRKILANAYTLKCFNMHICIYIFSISPLTLHTKMNVGNFGLYKCFYSLISADFSICIFAHQKKIIYNDIVEMQKLRELCVHCRHTVAIAVCCSDRKRTKKNQMILLQRVYGPRMRA